MPTLRTLFDNRVGWAYPVLVFLTFGYLYARIGRHVPLALPETDPAGSPPAAAVR